MARKTISKAGQLAIRADAKAAFHRGETLENNPYVLHTEKRLWTLSWFEAKLDKIKLDALGR